MSKKLQRLKEVNATLKNVLKELEYQIFINTTNENNNNITKINKQNIVVNLK